MTPNSNGQNGHSTNVQTNIDCYNSVFQIFGPTIFNYLSNDDLSNCRLVCKSWNQLITSRDPDRRVIFTQKHYNRILKRIASSEDDQTSPKNMDDYVKRFFRNCVQMTFTGKIDLPNRFYETLFNSNRTLRKLVIRGPTKYRVCKCPDGLDFIPSDALSSQTNNSQSNFNHSKSTNQTELEELELGTTFHINACALIDLIHRSPKLKRFKFYGQLHESQHLENFPKDYLKTKIESVHWPYIAKAPSNVLEFILKSSQCINSIFGPDQLILSLLASHLQEVKSLAINMLEPWKFNSLAYNYTRSRQLANLKELQKLQTLELRTHIFYEGDPTEDRESESVSNCLEHYLNAFCEALGNLKSLRSLSIFGSWEFNKTCRNLAKVCLEIEFLRINLHPKSVRDSLNSGGEIIFKAPEGLQAIRRLPKLKFLCISCSEKVADFSDETTNYLKILINAIYILDIKVNLTPNVKKFLKQLVKHGKQTNKVFIIRLYAKLFDNEPHASIIFDVTTNFPAETDVGAELEKLALKQLKMRSIDSSHLSSISVWHIKLDSVGGEHVVTLASMEKQWNTNFGQFDQDLYLQM